MSPITAGGREGASLVNEIGAFGGTVVLPKGTRYLAITADGTWTTRIAKLASAPTVPTAGYLGEGKAVVKLPKAAKRGTRVTLTHDGESNFIVRPLKTSGKAGMSVVNEIGTYPRHPPAALRDQVPRDRRRRRLDREGRLITPGSRRAARPSRRLPTTRVPSQWGLRSSTSHPTGTG